jgi:hypothetical protein
MTSSSSTTSFEWLLAGWLGLSPATFWILLGAAAAAAAGLAFWSYRRALGRLSAGQSLGLAGLRLGLVLCLLAALAGPARTERHFSSPRDGRPLAVLVDRSPSMAVADQHGESRLAAAVRLWRKAEPSARTAFPALRFFTFSAVPRPAGDLEAALAGPAGASETRLYDSIDQVLKEAPPSGYGGLVCLTDGLDTTDQTSAAGVARALRDRVPLSFAAAEGRSLGATEPLIRETVLPGQVLRNTQFTAGMVLEMAAAHPTDLAVSIRGKVNGASTTLHLKAGNNVLYWSTPLQSGEPGSLPVEFKVGEGARAQVLRAAVPVAPQERISVLIYQGSLDWTARFIKSAIGDDPTFSLHYLFDPRLRMPQDTHGVPRGVKRSLDLPNSPGYLEKNYDVVVLVNFGPRGPDQEEALREFVGSGGSLLLIVPDNAAAYRLVGSPLNVALPVRFDTAGTEPPPPRAQGEYDFQENEGDQNAGGPPVEGELKPLTAFALPPGPVEPGVLQLFTIAGAGPLIPKFATYAKVGTLKPDAQVLAVHPTEKLGDTLRPLLVTHRYLYGWATVLLTDGLWRWKMSLPSGAGPADVFWQQLLRKLGDRESEHSGMRFTQQPFQAALGARCAFRLEGAHGGDPIVTAVSPSGVAAAAAVTPEPAGGAWTFAVTTGEPGRWLIRAVDGRGAQMETSVLVSTLHHGEEFSGLPPDSAGLRALAEATGGSMLADGVPSSWRQAAGDHEATVVSVRRELLWDQWPLLLAGLGCYVAELVLRRRAKLL